MNIRIIAVGKIKERYLSDGIKEYSKRIKRYGNIEIIELKEESFSEPLSAKELEMILEKEAGLILNKINPRAHVIALDRQGQGLSSEKLAKNMQNIALMGTNQIDFIIGGSLGLSKEVVKQADFLLSFSKMTFPHQLMRLILLEQIYRAFTILRGEKYHK